MPDKYVYFVSYTHSWNGGQVQGFGNLELTRNSPITQYSDINAIAKVIRETSEKETNRVNIGIVILNYQLLYSEVEDNIDPIWRSAFNDSP